MSRSFRLATQLRSRVNLATDFDRRLRERWTREWAVGLEAGVSVLDAGAGATQLANSFARQRYFALDIAPMRLTSGLRCAGDLAALPFRDESFAHVLCIQVLEHVREPELALREMARTLQPGGTLCLSVPQSDPEHEQPHDYYRFTSFSLAVLARAAGLDVEDLRKRGGYFRRLSAQLRDLPFVVLPEDRKYRLGAARTLMRWALVVVFTVVVSLLLIGIDRVDRVRNYTTGYFCIFRKPGPMIARNEGAVDASP